MAESEHIEPDKRVVIADPDGKLYRVPSSQVEKAQRQGFRVATAEEIQARDDEKEYGEGFAPVAAGAAGLARGVTGGLSDVALTQTGLVEGETLSKLRDYNPTTSAVTDVAGTVGGLLIPGGALAQGAKGASMLARGGRAAAFVPRLGAGAAKLTEQAVSRGLGPRLGQTLIGRGVALGSAGAVEGAVYESTRALSETALEGEGIDLELAAERMLAGAEDGAVLGGLFGGALGVGVAGAGKALAGAGRLVGGMGRRAAGAVKGAAKQADEAAGAAAVDTFEETVKRTETVVDDVEAALAQIDAAPGSKFAPRTGEAVDEAVAAARDVAKTPGVRESFDQAKQGLRDMRLLERAREQRLGPMSDQITDLHRTASELLDGRDGFTIAQKIRAVGKELKRRKLGADEFEAMRERARESAAHVQGTVKTLSAKHSRFVGERGVNGNVGRLHDHKIPEALKMIDEATVAKPEKLFEAIDILKRDVGRAARNMSAKSTAREELEALYLGGAEGPGGLRGFLEDAALWGDEVVAKQLPANAKWTGFLDVARSFEKRFMEISGTAGKDATGFELLRSGDPRKIKKLFEELGRPEAAADRKVFRDYMVSRAELLEELATSHEATRVQRKLVDRMREQTDGVLRELDEMTALSERVASTKEIVQAVQDLPFVGALARAAVAGERLIGEGGVAEVVTRAAPLQYVRKIGTAVVDDIKDYAGRALDPAKRTTKKTVTETTKKTVKRAQRYDNAKQQVQEVAGNPQTLVERMAERIGEFSGAAPKFSSAAVRAATRGAIFLQDKLPQENRNADLFPHLDYTQRVSDREQAKWLRYVDGVENPLGVIEDFANGNATREGIEALRVVYPKMYGQLVTSVFEQLGELDKPPAYADQINLSILLGQPVHPSMTPRFIRGMQQHYEQQKQKKQKRPPAPSNQRAPKLSESQQTTAQRIEAG